MVNTLGETQNERSTVSQMLDHKLMPTVVAIAAFFALNAFETFQGKDADLEKAVQAMQVDLAIVKARTEQFSDSAPNRWTRQMQNQYAAEIDRRFDDVNQRLERSGM